MAKHYREKRKTKRRKGHQEKLTAYDENMNVIGDYPRTVVHYNKMWHRVVQCWIARKTEKGVIVYLQRRSFEKHSNPGRYDVTSGGHVAAGENPETAILREMKEETGLKLDRGRLTEIGTCREVAGFDKEFVHIFLYIVDSDPQFAPGREVIYMVSTDLEALKELSEGTRNEILVVPEIRTGALVDEAFKVNQRNFCNHESFSKVVYPFIRRVLVD